MKKITYFLGLTLVVLSLQSCFLLGGTVQTESVAELAVGSKVGEKTIIAMNPNSGSWKFLAMGTPSETMPWDLNASKYLTVSYLSTDIGRGKANTIDLRAQFEENGSKTHTAENCAAIYCMQRGGWLPSRDEAAKVAEFTSVKFWTSNAEATSKAYFYNPISQHAETAFRNERRTIVTIPVYYLDALGNVVEP